jgi:hypothetical protein
MGMDQSHISRGIAIADVDGDGRLDYAVANQWEDSIFFHNVSPHTGAFLGLRIQWANGTPVIGASASVELPDGRHLVGQLDGGSGHSGKRSPEVHFGLGGVAPDRPLPVTIRWRHGGGIETARYHLKPGWQTVKLQERP